MVLLLRKQLMQRWAFFSVAILLVNLFTWQYLALDIETVNLDLLSGKCIAIDPGHGGIDEGTSWFGLAEKDINLAIALQLRDILVQHGAQVILTREDDRDYYTKGKGGKRHDLLERVGIINQSPAQLYISLHVNADRYVNSSGPQVFYNPKIEENKVLAETMQRGLLLLNGKSRREIKQDSTIIVLNATTKPGIFIGSWLFKQ